MGIVRRWGTEGLDAMEDLLERADRRREREAELIRLREAWLDHVGRDAHIWLRNWLRDDVGSG